MNKSKNIIILSLAIIILVGVGVFFFFGNKNTSETAVTSPEETIMTIQPEEIGLVVKAVDDMKKVIIEVNKTEGIASIDYELTYTAKGDVERGTFGQIEIKEPGKAVSRENVLGTCSDVCHYDEDVSNIKVTMKATKSDGAVVQTEKSL